MPKGSAVQLEVGIESSAPASFRWRKDGIALSDFSRVFGSTTARLNINSVQTNDAGDYQVIVNNNFGAVTSVLATLTIAPAERRPR